MTKGVMHPGAETIHEIRKGEISKVSPDFRFTISHESMSIYFDLQEARGRGGRRK